MYVLATIVYLGLSAKLALFIVVSKKLANMAMRQRNTTLGECLSCASGHNEAQTKRTCQADHFLSMSFQRINVGNDEHQMRYQNLSATNEGSL